MYQSASQEQTPLSAGRRTTACRDTVRYSKLNFVRLRQPRDDIIHFKKFKILWRSGPTTALQAD